MLGKIIIPRGSASVEAFLEEDGKWRCESSKEVQMLLNMEFSLIGQYGGPSQGAPGAASLHDAAKRLHGKMEYLADIPKHDPNIEY